VVVIILLALFCTAFYYRDFLIKVISPPSADGKRTPFLENDHLEMSAHDQVYRVLPGYEIGLRKQPTLQSAKAGQVLSQGSTFQVDQTVVDCTGQHFLHVMNQGWAFQFHPKTGTPVCALVTTQLTTTAFDVSAANEANAAKLSGSQHTSATGGATSLFDSNSLYSTFDANSDVPFAPALRESLGGRLQSDEAMKWVSAVRMVQQLSERAYSNRWSLEEVVGVGGTATVVRANDRVLKQAVAIKVLLPSQGTPVFGKEEQRRLKRERLAMQRVNHPNVVRFFDAIYDEGKRMYMLVIELAVGTSLQQVLDTRGPLSQPRLLEIAVKLLSALEELHSKNIIHLRTSCTTGARRARRGMGRGRGRGRVGVGKTGR
jgi:hypothetical protein